MTKKIANSRDPYHQTVEQWLNDIAQKQHLSKGVTNVLNALRRNPEMASYASAMDVGAAADVNVATVTRAAQALGFSGWPEWRQEIRARFLGRLTSHKLAAVHEYDTVRDLSDATLTKHMRDLAALKKTQVYQTIQNIAGSIASARRCLIVAAGSYAGLAKILAHRAQNAGYRCEIADDGVSLANALVGIGPDDVIIMIDLWRLYKTSRIAALEGKRRGATVCIIADAALMPIHEYADFIVVVPSESTSFFPSMVPAMSIIECICAELAKINPERSANALEASDHHWQVFDLLYYRSDEDDELQG